MWIYKLTNNVNGKIYVGKAKELAKRIYMHSRAYDAERSALHRAIKKYGFESFSVDVLEQGITSETDLNRLEIEWIEKLSACDRSIGYNLTAGGEGALGNKWSDEARAKMSKQRKGRPTSDRQREASRMRLLGMVYSEETLAKMSDGSKKRSSSPEYRKKLSLALRGKAKSDSHKASLRDAFRNRKATRMIEHNGERHPIAEWARRIGLSGETIRYRIDIGWPISDALTLPRQQKGGPK